MYYLTSRLLDFSFMLDTGVSQMNGVWQGNFFKDHSYSGSQGKMHQYFSPSRKVHKQKIVFLVNK